MVSMLMNTGVVAVEPHWLPQLAPYHCRFSKPLEDPPPSWGEDTGKVMCHMKSTFGELMILAVKIFRHVAVFLLARNSAHSHSYLLCLSRLLMYKQHLAHMDTCTHSVCVCVCVCVCACVSE